MSKDSPNVDVTGTKRKYEDQEGDKKVKRRRRGHRKSRQSALENSAIETFPKVETTEELPDKPEHVDVGLTGLGKQHQLDQHTPKGAWTLGSVKGGCYADRDPIFMQDNIVTAIGDKVKVLNTITSLELASLPTPSGTSLVSFDAICTPDKDLIRVLYSNGVLMDWDWTTNSTNELAPAAKMVDLYRLTTIDGRIASLSTTWDDKRCTIMLNGKALYNTEHRIMNLRSLFGAAIIVALCRRAVIIGRKDLTDKHTWMELPWSKRATCFDIRERIGGKQQEFSMVIGEEDGLLQLYNNVSSLFTQAELPSPQRLHWHRNSVAAVKFSPDGNYLVSGGLETVLVMWQLATGHKSYLPNLTSPIEGIVINAAGNRYALKMGDNSIMVLSTTELKPVANFAGLQLTPNKRLAATIHPIETNRFLLSAASNWQAKTRPFLQTFDVETDRHVSRQALTRNNVTDLKDSPEHGTILPPDVEHLAVSVDGTWLATIDTWTLPHRDLMYLATEELMSDEDRLARSEVYLKIWRWNPDTSEWMLNSRIDRPHSSGSKPAKVFKLVSDTTRSGFFTVGEDCVLRTWRPQRKVRHGLVPKNEEEIEWICKSTVELEKSEDRTDLDHEASTPTNAALGISEDGSLLAICVLTENQPQIIHLIDTDTGDVKSSHDNIAAPELVEISFIDQYLVTLSRHALRVWDVVGDTLHYATRVQGTASPLLAVSVPDNAIAVASFAVGAAPSAISVYRVQPAELRCRIEIEKPVAAILTHPHERGFRVIFEDATTAMLTSTSALSSTQQAVLAQGSASEVVVVPVSTVPAKLIEAEAAIISTEPQAEDDRSVVRPEQLAKIFDVGTSTTALPSVREMFHAVAGLFGRKPRVI